MEDSRDLGLELELKLGFVSQTFDLAKAVSNHGFFMMAPNRWIPSAKTLQRPLRLADSSTSVLVSISHPPSPTAPDDNSTSLLVRVHHATRHISSEDQRAIFEQVIRMLRISERDERDVMEFHRVHPQAKDEGFGRVFRSPSLFEDMVKSILLCHCTWGRSLNMAQALCELQQEIADSTAENTAQMSSNDVSLVEIPKKRRRKRRSKDMPTKRKKFMKLLACSGSTIGNPRMEREASKLVGNFPTPSELANVSVKYLNDRCKLGYRAKPILELARNVERGFVKLEQLEQATRKQIGKRLMKIEGVGNFACATIMMCLGYYDEVPVDSETTNLIEYGARAKTQHGKKTKKKDVKKRYHDFAPFQCLAYWFELLGGYEKKFGPLSELPPTQYHIVTGRGGSFDKTKSDKIENP